MVISHEFQSRKVSYDPTVYVEGGDSERSPKKATRMRFVVCVLGVVSLAMSQMSRSVINFCITSMVDPRMLETHKAVSEGGSCPAMSTAGSDADFSGAGGQKISWNLTETYTTSIENWSPESLAAGTSEDRFMWTIEQQSYVLGGFYYSYSVFMILGGRLAEMYGAKYVMLVAVASSGIINLATPWLARYSVVLVTVSRILMGALQSSVYPAMYALSSRWLTEGEVSIFTSMIKLSLRLGQVLASLIPGLILEWPRVFYVVGAMGVIWSVLWIFIATSDPSDNRWVSKTELAHIMKKKKKNTNNLDGKSPPPKAPWLQILTSPSVIGLLVVKFTYNCCNDFMTIELASYLKYVHHVSMQTISAIATTVFTLQVSLVLLAGWLAKVMVQRRPCGLSKTAIRKIFQSTVSFGSGALLFLLIFNQCNMTYVTADLLLIGFVSIFVVGGEMMVPYDLSEEYPATIMAIANSAANLSGIIVTTLTGLILGNEGGSQARWNMVLATIACIDSLGGLVFCLLVKAKPIDFKSAEEQKDQIQDVEGATVDR